MSSTTWPRRARSSSVRRPALAGLPDAGDRLVAVERLGRARPLHHGELHQLEGGEPLLAGWQQRRRRMEQPSSATRESRTLVSVLRQNGQCTDGSSSPGQCWGRASQTPVRGVDISCSRCVQQPNGCGSSAFSWGLDVDNYIGVSTRCSGYRTPPPELPQDHRRVILIRTAPTAFAQVRAGTAAVWTSRDRRVAARTGPAANDLQMPRWGQARGRCGSDHGERAHGGRRTPESRGSPCPTTPIA